VEGGREGGKEGGKEEVELRERIIKGRQFRFLIPPSLLPSLPPCFLKKEPIGRPGPRI